MEKTNLELLKEATAQITEARAKLGRITHNPVKVFTNQVDRYLEQAEVVANQVLSTHEGLGERVVKDEVEITVAPESDNTEASGSKVESNNLVAVEDQPAPAQQ